MHMQVCKNKLHCMPPLPLHSQKQSSKNVATAGCYCHSAVVTTFSLLLLLNNRAVQLKFLRPVAASLPPLVRRSGIMHSSPAARLPLACALRRSGHGRS